MELQTKKEHYRKYLKIYGSLIYDLSESDEYIKFLIESDNLHGFDAMLKGEIEEIM